MRIPSSEIASATSATAPVVPGIAPDGLNANATAMRIDARPALKRKNLTPASRETATSVAMTPTPRCARKRKRTVDKDMYPRLYRSGESCRVGRVGQVGRVGRHNLPDLRDLPDLSGV